MMDGRASKRRNGEILWIVSGIYHLSRIECDRVGFGL